MPTIDDINEKLRDFVGWNSANPLPTGDPETGVFHPSKKDLRDLFIAILQAQGDPDALDRIIAAVSKGATTRANAVAIGQANLPTSVGLLFNRAGPGLDTLEVRTAGGTTDPLFAAAPLWGRIQSLATLEAVQRITSQVTLTAASGNAANAIVGTTPAPLQDGAVIAYRALFANGSGEVTIRVNDLPALPLYDYEGGPIMRGDIPLNSMVYARYFQSSNQFRLNGPVRHQRPTIVVQKAEAEINIYQQASGDFYKHYRLERVPVPARNSDVWRIVQVAWRRALSRSNYAFIADLTTPNSEIEQVIYLDGAIEGIGGSIHGNEIATAFSMSIDGGTVGTDGWYACERVALFQTSSGYRPGSTLATEYSPLGPEVFRTNREWHFADGCLTLNNTIVNLASGYTVLRGYVGMCPLRLAQTSRVAHFPYSEIYPTGGTVDRISNSHRMIGWGPDYYGDVEVIRGWDSATAEMRMKLDSAPEGKMYPDALRGRVTVAGQTWAFSTRLRFGTAEEITAIPQDRGASLGDVSEVARKAKASADEAASYAAFATRAAAISTDISPQVQFINVGGLSYQADASGTALATAGDRRWSPVGGGEPEHFGADVDAFDNTAALNAFIDYSITFGFVPNWGSKNRVFQVTGNLERFYETPHTGLATVTRAGGSLVIGPQFGVENVVHVAPSGAGDGITPDTPRALSSAFPYWRQQLANCVGIKLTFSLAEGTYTGTTMRPIDLPQMDFPWRFVGPVDGGGVPTAVFDIPSFTSSRVFYRTQGGARFLGKFENLRFNGPGSAIDLRFNIEAYCDNVHYYGTKGSGAAAFVFRDGVAEFTGGRVQGASTGVMFQACYSEAGAHSDNVGAQGTAFVDCEVGVATTRQSSGYARQNTFSGCDINIQVDRNARVRSQGNTHTNWSIAAIDADMGGLWNDDPSLPDLFPGTVTGVQVLRQRRGGIITPSIAANSSELVCNNRSVGPATINATERTQFPTATHAAFRVPGFWLKSPTARGTWKALLLAPAGVSALLEITGAASNAVVAAITLPSTAGAGHWEIEVNLFGADSAGGQPRYFCKAHHLRNDVQTRVVSEGTFSANTAAIADNLLAGKVFPVYLTPSAAGNFNLRHFDSYVSF